MLIKIINLYLEDNIIKVELMDQSTQIKVQTIAEGLDHKIDKHGRQKSSLGVMDYVEWACIRVPK